MNRALLTHKLKKFLPNPIVTEATTGEEALLFLSEDSFDIAFLDEHFGNTEGAVLRGTEVSRAVHELQKNHSLLALPLMIGVTGNAGQIEEEPAASGQVARWGKPIPGDAEEQLAGIIRSSVLMQRAP